MEETIGHEALFSAEEWDSLDLYDEGSRPSPSSGLPQRRGFARVHDLRPAGRGRRRYRLEKLGIVMRPDSGGRVHRHKLGPLRGQTSGEVHRASGRPVGVSGLQRFLCGLYRLFNNGVVI